jgi:hypothetical protein
MYYIRPQLGSASTNTFPWWLGVGLLGGAALMLWALTRNDRRSHR